MRLKKLREQVDLTQKELGKMLSVEQHTVSQWENGDRMPRADKLPELARLFNCSIDELFEEKKNEETE